VGKGYRNENLDFRRAHSFVVYRGCWRPADPGLWFPTNEDGFQRLDNRKNFHRQDPFFLGSHPYSGTEPRTPEFGSRHIGCLQNPELEPLLMTHLLQVRSFANLPRMACLLLRSSTKYCLLSGAESKSPLDYITFQKWKTEVGLQNHHTVYVAYHFRFWIISLFTRQLAWSLRHWSLHLIYSI
jgi:hypothetical protein